MAPNEFNTRSSGSCRDAGLPLAQPLLHLGRTPAAEEGTVDKVRFDRAIQAYDEALRLDPNYSPAFWSRGFAYWKRGQYGAAIRDFYLGVRRKRPLEWP